MDLKTYLENRRLTAEQALQKREICTRCFQPHFTCYCHLVVPFDPKIKFVILIHPIEDRRRIASGRMSHLCLIDSELILGVDYSNHPQVNAILKNPVYHPLLLYPGPQAINLSKLSLGEKTMLCPSDKKPVVFVIDGTWNTARKTLRLSTNLQALPRISFSANLKSNFRVRSQPDPHCFSTLEAIHQTIELLGKSQNFETENRAHDALLKVFDHLVEDQLERRRTIPLCPRRKISKKKTPSAESVFKIETK